MEAEWKCLVDGIRNGTLSSGDRVLAKKFAQAIAHLQDNPFHPGLQSHEIDSLSKRYGVKVFESYLENNTPSVNGD